MDFRVLRVPDGYFVPESIVDGSGLRSVIFVQGCGHNCKGCHNRSTWDFNGGHEVEIDEVYSKIEQADSFLHKGITLTGGEPMLQCVPLLSLVRMYKSNFSKNVWCYSGFTYEQIVARPKMKELLKEIDVLVDGKFIEEQKSLHLKFKGSENQRIIDVKKSREENRIVLWEGDTNEV